MLTDLQNDNNDDNKAVNPENDLLKLLNPDKKKKITANIAQEIQTKKQEEEKQTLDKQIKTKTPNSTSNNSSKNSASSTNSTASINDLNMKKVDENNSLVFLYQKGIFSFLSFCFFFVFYFFIFCKSI
jgi:hypothetical protein